MSYEADQPYDHHAKTMLKARKAHECNACEQTINPGEIYCRVYAVFDGTSETHVRCGRCETLHQRLCKEHYDRDNDMYPDERLGCGKSWMDEFREDPPEDVQALVFMESEEAGQLLAQSYQQDLESRRRGRNGNQK